MNDKNTTECSYRYDPIERLQPAEVVDVPRDDPPDCPHPGARGEEDRCLFHSSDREFPPEAIAEEFLDILDSPERDPVFAGGRFGDLDLSEQTLDTPSGDPIDLRGATIDGTLNLGDATVEVPLLLGQAAITGSIEAEDAQFRAPIDLAETSVGGSLHLHDATFEAGVAANGLDAGFVDARALSAGGPAVFDGASFTANVQFARGRFDERLSFEGAEFERLIDFTALEAAGDVSFAMADVGEEATFVAATVDGDCSLVESHVAEEADFSHAVLNGDVDAEDATFDEELLFKDVRCRGDRLRFDGASVGERADFSYLDCSGTSVSMHGASFDGEVWFTHSSFDGPLSLRDARFGAFAHLRDAEFHDDLTLRGASFESQSYLHGSTVDGDVDASEATFDHFQFSATVAGDIDFRGTRFDSRGLFSRSEVGGEATFDDASFAGNPDFSDSRFKGPVSFRNTEFLVEPTFEGTRFAVDPDLEAAIYPQDSSKDLEDHRRNIIVARPEHLLNQGLSIPMDAVSDDPVIPASAYELTQPSPDLARAITGALNAIDGADWYDLFERAMELSRTAASKVEDDERATLVYGISIAPDADGPEEFLDAARLVGVYEVEGSEEGIRFSYLDPEIEEVDYLVAVPASDSAFQSGVSVGVRSEFATAVFRRQVLQTALLEREGVDPHFVGEFLPVLVGIGRVD